MRTVTCVTVLLALSLAALPLAAQPEEIAPPEAAYGTAESSVAFSPDGGMLAGVTEGVVKTWEIASGDPVAPLTDLGTGALCVEFSPGGDHLAIGCTDGSVLVYDRGGELTFTLEGHTDYVRDLAFTPAGGILASGSDDGTVRLWDMASGDLIREITGHPDYVRSVAFGPSGQLIATACDDGVVRLWDADNGELLRELKGHTDYVRSVAISPDGSLVASGSDDTTVRLWSAVTGEEMAVLSGHSDWVRSVAFSPDGTTLASGSDDGSVNLWSVATREVKRSLEVAAWVMSVAFSADGSRLATGSADGQIGLWDPVEGNLIARAGGAAPMLLKLALSPDGRTLVGGTEAGEVRVWDLQSEAGPATTFQLPNVFLVQALDFNADGDRIAAGGIGSEVAVMDPASGEVVQSLTAPEGILALHFDRRGKLWGASTEGVVTQWNVEDGEVLQRVGAIRHPVMVLDTKSGRVLKSNERPQMLGSAIFADDGSRLMAGAGQLGALCLALSPNGRLLATGGRDGTVQIGSADKLDGEPLEGAAHTDYVRGLAFSPDGRLLASASDDGTVKLWSVDRRRLLRTFEGHTDWVRDVLFIDNDQLVSCADDGTARVWSASSGDQLRVLHTVGPNANELLAP